MKSKKSVKNIIYRVLSGVLAIVSCLAIVASFQGLRDFIEIYCNLTGSTVGGMIDSFVSTPGQTQEEDTSTEELPEEFSGAAAQLYVLYDGLNQLSENEDVYFDGVNQYNDGLKQLADGKKQIADNTDAYNDGKALINTLDTLGVPGLVEKYVAWRDKNVNVPGFSTAQEYFVKVISPLLTKAGVEIPEGTTDVPQYLIDMIADGRSQLKMYEDGLVQIADGEQQLADGDAQLKQFEDGEQQIQDEGYTAIFALQTQKDKKGNVVLESPADHFGYTDGTLDIYQKNADGSYKLLRNGKKALDLDLAYDIMWYAVDYAHDMESMATEELVPRVVLYVLCIIGGIFGLVSGLKGIFGKGKIGTIIAALFAIGINVYGISTGYTNYVFRLADGSYSGDTQFHAFVAFLVASVLAAVFACLNFKKHSKKNKDAKVEDIVPAADDAAEAVAEEAPAEAPAEA